MPSPIISRSTSDPFLSSSSKTKTHHYRRGVLTSSHSITSSSSRSSKSSYWRAWSNITKLGSFISIGRKSDASSDLTQESLEAHNKRQEAFILHTEIVNTTNHQSIIDDYNAKCSPYYKGLTDYSLIINREKSCFPPNSPGRESHAATAITTTSSTSFVLVKKVQAWTSCFIYSNKSSRQNDANVSIPVSIQVSVPPTTRSSRLPQVEATVGVEHARPYVTASPLPQGEAPVKVEQGRSFGRASPLPQGEAPVGVEEGQPFVNASHLPQGEALIGVEQGRTFVNASHLPQGEAVIGVEQGLPSVRASPSPQGETALRVEHAQSSIKASPLPQGEAAIGVEQGRPFVSSCCSSSSQKKKETDNKNVLKVVNEEKPLRERVSPSCESNKPSPSPPSSLPSPPPRTEPTPPPPSSSSSTSNVDDKNEKIIDMVHERKYTWADKYRPKVLKDFICHKATVAKVHHLVKEIDCNHFIFEGPAGVGKRTMVWAMIQEAFGPDTILQTREVCKSFRLKGEAIGSIEVKIKKSFQHIEINLSDLKGYEKHVIVQLIKEANNKKKMSQNDTCRAIILCNAEKLSADAVLYIRWMLERYNGSSKFFFCCSEISKLHPLKEHCTYVQLSLPSDEEIVEVLEYIAKQEGIDLPRPFAERITKSSKNNLRQAVRSFEALWQKSYPFTEDQVILTGWEDDIANIAKDMIQEQSPKQLYIIRGKLQNLIDHDVSPEFIFETLVIELKNNLDDFCRVQLDGLYKDYNRKDGNMLEAENQLLFPNSRIEKASGKRAHDPAKKKFHQFMNIEEFIAKFMSQYKLHITTNKTMQHDAGT